MKIRYSKCLIIFILISTFAVSAVFAVDRVGNIDYAPPVASDPGIVIIADTKIPVLKAGESAVLEIPVKTSSIYTAFDVVAHITTSDDKLPFELENMSPYSKPIQVFYNIPTKIEYNIYVPNIIVSGVYPVNLDISYGDMFSSTYTKSIVFYVKIENTQFDASTPDYLTVSDYDIPEIVEKDSSFTAGINLKNMSGIQINKASVEIVLPSGINVANDTAIKGGAFAVGDVVKFNFNLRSSKTVESGIHPITFKVSVYGKDNTTVVQEFSFNSVVNIPDDKYYYNPMLEISDVKVPQQVKPGEDFTVLVTYKNTGDCELRYIKTELVSDVSAETFVNKSPTSHLIKSIAVGESVEKEYVFTASEKAKGDFYDLQFNATAKYDISANEEGEISDTQYSGFYIMRDAVSLSPYSITDVTIPKRVAPEDEFILTFNVNVNTYVEGLKIEAVLPEGIINTTPNVFWYDAAKEGSVLTHEVELMCSEDVTEGYGAVKISLGAQNLADIYQYTGVYIEGGSSAKPYYSISDIVLPSSVDVARETEFELTFTVTCLNAADEEVAIDVALPAGIINRSLSKFYIGDMKEGESVTKTVKLSATQEAADGFANIEISVSSENTEKLGQFTGLNINNSLGGRDDIPVVIIDEYDYGTDYVLGGATFPLKLKFLNTSITGGVKDLKITLASDEDGVFTPAASSNTYFIQNLAPCESAEWNLDIQTKSDIKPQSYGFIINISYKNDNGDEKSDVEMLTIPVRQEMRFNISDLPVINDISMNEDAILTLNCANLGKSTVYNVLIKIQGNFSSTEYEIFAGNIEAGKGYSNTVYLTPMMEGMQEGTVTFQYEDADGVVTTEEKIISFNAYSMDMNMGVMMPVGPDEIQMDDTPEEENTSLSGWFWYVVAGGVVVLALIVIVVIVKVRKSIKKKEDDDED